MNCLFCLESIVSSLPNVPQCHLVNIHAFSEDYILGEIDREDLRQVIFSIMGRE